MDEYLKDADPNCDHRNMIYADKLDLCGDCGGWFIYP